MLTLNRVMKAIYEIYVFVEYEVISKVKSKVLRKIIGQYACVPSGIPGRISELKMHLEFQMFQDLNIGIALWLAAGGDGWLYEPPGDDKTDEDPLRVAYKSTARILLVGSGADEQCAGYGRHKTKYRQGRYATVLILRQGFFLSTKIYLWVIRENNH